MSQNLRMSLDAMYDARIPEKWEKVKGYFCTTDDLLVILIDFMGIGNFRFLVY